MRLKRPSHATVVAYIALFFAMSGTAVAATGGTFILGRSNSATTTTSLTNSAGVALKLTSKSGYAPFSVGTNKLLVPYLNSDLLDGLTSASFLRSTGTAANAQKLDGIDSTGFLGTTGTAYNSSRLGGYYASDFMKAQSHSCYWLDTFVTSVGSDGSLTCNYPLQPLWNSFVLASSSCPSGTTSQGTYYLSDYSGSTRTGFLLCRI
jgi:hypothetical protein